MEGKDSWRRKLRSFYDAVKRLPPVMRSLAGVLLIAGGLLSFLPILGLWMAPLGVIMIALDIPPLRNRVEEWLN